MSLEKTTAIILRVVEFSETSCIVTMMTREYGKVTAMAKGARRPKSPFEAALDVLAVCRIVFLKKSSGAMDLLTEARLERRFRAGSFSLNRLYAGYYVGELLNLLTDDADPHPDLFDLAIETIEAIDTPDTTESGETEILDNMILDFELASLHCLGHLPMLTQCVGCGKEKTAHSRVSFGMNSGGILCSKCRAGKRNVVSLSASGYTFLLNRTWGIQKQQLKQLKENESGCMAVHEGNSVVYQLQPDSPEDETSSDSSSDTPIREVRSLVRTYMTHLIGYPPRMQKFLNLGARHYVANQG
jgi:DNA repair protein RecO (recombination protein O)